MGEGQPLGRGAGVIETDLRPANLMEEQATRQEQDVAWLSAHRKEFVRVPCPACRRNFDEERWEKHGLVFVTCEYCGTVYANPRPSRELLAEFYRHSENYAYWTEEIFPATEEARREIMRERAEKIGACDILIDVGAGFGTFAEEALAMRTVVVEPEPHLAEVCWEKGLEVIPMPIEQAPLPTADVITAFELIEHLFSPRDFLRICAGALKRGGRLVLTCPNVRGFEVEVLGADSSTVALEHLNLFHPASLQSLLEAEGFTVLESETPGRLDCELVGIRDEGLQDFLVAQGRSSHMWMVATR